MGERGRTTSLPLTEIPILAISGIILGVLAAQAAAVLVLDLGYPRFLPLLAIIFPVIGYAATREELKRKAKPGLRIVDLLAVVAAVRVLLLIETSHRLSHIPREMLLTFLHPGRLLTFEQVWYSLVVGLGCRDASGVAEALHNAGTWLRSKRTEVRDNHLLDTAMRSVRRTNFLGVELLALSYLVLVVGWYKQPQIMTSPDPWYRATAVLLILAIFVRLTLAGYTHLLVRRIDWDSDDVAEDEGLARRWSAWSLLVPIAAFLLAWALPKAFLPFSSHTIAQFIRRFPMRFLLGGDENSFESSAPDPGPPDDGGSPRDVEMSLLDQIIGWLQLSAGALVLLVLLIFLCLALGLVLSFILRTESARAGLLPRLLIGFYRWTRGRVQALLQASWSPARRFLPAVLGGLARQWPRFARWLRRGTARVFGSKRARVAAGSALKEHGMGRRSGPSPADDVIRVFLSVVEHAHRSGVHRKPSDTALEFSSHLKERIPEAQAEVESLTQSFLESRYARLDHVRSRDVPFKRFYRAVVDAIDRLRS